VIRAIDHVQLAMPPGEEAKARAFYGDLLGMQEEEKPPVLAARGGVWFRAGEARVHLGVEREFRPARKAHPALGVEGLAGLVARMRNAGVEVIDDEALPGFDRVYVSDPFGNRLELLEKKTS
jgi:catechol 2,3-dioxygenase-like lactoylglutathione lyase family enzyme